MRGGRYTAFVNSTAANAVSDSSSKATADKVINASSEPVPSRTVLVTATSYPRSDSDWQGLFIQRLVDALATTAGHDVDLWAPPGPLAEGVGWAGNDADAQFLTALAERGGIAHLLRKERISGVYQATQLLRRLRALYRRSTHDIVHVHWLQNALPLLGLGRRVVVSVLGSDYAMLKLPGMVTALRRVFASNNSVLTPNAPWMAPELERHFGDIARIVPVNFGIDDIWFTLEHRAAAELQEWLCVSRVTEGKVGDLFDWGEEAFDDRRHLTLIGPNQGDLDIPPWINFRGSATPEELASQWFPYATGLLSLSRHAEGRPQVMLEAMAAGLPVVASALPAHDSTVIDGTTGYIVRSSQEFLDAMHRLQDRTLCEEMGIAARHTARDVYGTWHDCARRFAEVYQSLQ